MFVDGRREKRKTNTAKSLTYTFKCWNIKIKYLLKHLPKIRVWVWLTTKCHARLALLGHFCPESLLEYLFNSPFKSNNSNRCHPLTARAQELRTIILQNKETHVMGIIGISFITSSVEHFNKGSTLSFTRRFWFF